MRLRGVREEYDAASAALSVLADLWGDARLSFGRPITLHVVKRARNNLEVTYFVRLHAEFESILRDEVQSQGGNIGDDPKVRELEVRAIRLRGKRRKSLDYDAWLFHSLDQIHRHRNHVAHGNAPAGAIVLAEALNAFNTFLSRLVAP